MSAAATETLQLVEPMIDEAFRLVPMSEVLRRHRDRIAWEVAEGRRPSGHYNGPISVHWEFTNRCNLRCEFCYNASTSRPGQHLPDERLWAIADELAELKVLEVTLSGGEVLMEPQRLWSLGRRLQRNGISLRLITNAWFLDNRVAAQLAARGFDHVTVSVDAPEPSIHDRLRGLKGSWRRAIRGIGALARAGLPCSVTCVLTRENAGSIERLIEICDLLAVKSLTLEDLRDEGRGMESALRLRLSDLDYEAAYTRLCDLVSRCRPQCRIVFGASTRFALDIMTQQPPFTCCVRADGTVIPVEALPVSFGNVATEPLRAAWKRLADAYSSGEMRRCVTQWQTVTTPVLGIARSVRNMTAMAAAVDSKEAVMV